jgi:CRP-like cAMP-binding protein
MKTTDTALLTACPLFAGINEKDLGSLLGCLSGRERTYDKDETVLFAGDNANAVGIVLSGSVLITEEDYFGNRNILSEIHPAELFGEALACAEAINAPVTVVANEQSELLLIDYKRIVTTCPSACSFHSALIKNMLRILAQRNMALVEKMKHITKRTTQEKVLSYLSNQAKRHKSSAFEIPFNRQELADYLAVERSALSAELCKLRDMGKIRFRKNRFELITD